MGKKKSVGANIGTIIFTIIAIAFVSPIVIVVINSFKKKAFINLEPFTIPSGKSFAGVENYANGFTKYDFLGAVGWTVFITVFSVIVILVCCSMTAWYITRVKNKITKGIYLLCVFSMVIPFQMVMFTLSGTADSLGLNTPWGLIIVYLGFGAGLAVFMFCGFVKSIPIEIEEAAMIDGCSPVKTFFMIVLPIMKPTYISVGILEAMWIWNDFLLPLLMVNSSQKTKTLVLAAYTFVGQMNTKWHYAMTAMVLAVTPSIIIFILLQKHIVDGVVAGAVKG